MITELILERYGKFRNKNLSLSSFTLITGPNESGKSTITDALMEGITHPRGTTQAGRFLKERYGENRRVQLKFQGEPFAAEVEEFENIYCIRTGNATIALDSGRLWIDRLQNQIFSGGIDPVQLANQLRKTSSQHGGNPLVKSRRLLEERLAIIRSELAQQDTASAALARLESQRQDLRSRWTVIESERTLLFEKRRELAAKIQAGENRKTLQDLLQILTLLDEVPQKQEKQTWIELVRKQDEQIRNFCHERDQLTIRIQALQSTIRQLSARVERSEADRAENTLGEIEKQLQLAGRIEKDISRLSGAGTGGGWSLPMLVLSMIPIVAGLAFSYLAVERLNSIILALAGVVAGSISSALLLYTARKRPVDQPVTEGIKEALSQLSGTPLGKISYSQAEARVHEIITALEARRSVIAAREAAFASDSEEIESLEAERNSASRAYEEITERLSRILEQISVDSAEKIPHILSSGLTLGAEISENRRRLQELIGRYCPDIPLSGVRAWCQVRAQGLQNTETTPNEREMERYRAQDRELDETLTRIQTTREEVQSNLSELSGRISTMLEAIETAVPALRSELSSLEERLHDLELTQNASNLAAEVFDEMGGQSRETLDALSGDLSRVFTGAAGGSRGVHIQQLREHGILASDEEGELREIQHLSTGTRDLFYLSVRLFFASRFHPDPGVLVLDEPFGSFDEGRITRALELIEHFRTRKGWQIILLSKDSMVVESVKNTVNAASLAVIELAGKT